MEQSHMLAGRRPPGAQPVEDLEFPRTTIQHPTSPSVLGADASPMQASPEHPARHHALSADLSSRLDTKLCLQLPPLALSISGDSAPELAPIQLPHEKCAAPSNQTLPPISSVTGAHAQCHAPLPQSPESSHPSPYTRPSNYWPSLNPFTAYYTPSYLDPVESSPSMASETSAAPRASSVSLDDPDVRIAAEALGQMRTDFLSSPRYQATTPVDRKTSRDRRTTNNGRKQPEPEPLLSLITTSHPFLATTIEGAASAYNSGKNYSPHLKTGAEYVESYLNPVAKAVGNVSRKTGVEGGVRWIFGIRSRKQQSSSDLETGSNKRRKSERDGKAQRKTPDGQPSDFDNDVEDRRMSISTIDTLPAYDDHRSPAYTEVAEDQMMARPAPGDAGQPWGQRFVVTTSGLGVAMKQESLRSLKYCLKVLKDTNGYIGDVLVRLKAAIDEYDLATGHQGEDHAMTDGPASSTHTAADRSKLILLMSELRDDIFRVIHSTVQTVSKYAGSALPENARNLVHRQLMSLPGLYRFHYLRESSEGRGENASPEAWARNNAHLALLFAKEAVRMMTQVDDVLHRTLVSAEEWCETLSKKQDDQRESPLDGAESTPVPLVGVVNGDIKMSV